MENGKQTKTKVGSLTIDIKLNSDDVVAAGKAFQVSQAFMWRGCNNGLSSIIRYDKETETILVDKKGLMNVIRIVNPRQNDRDIRVVDGLLDRGNQQFTKISSEA